MFLQAVLERFQVLRRAVGDNDDGAAGGKVPENALQRLEAFGFVGNDEGGVRKEIIHPLQRVRLQNVRKSNGVNIHTVTFPLHKAYVSTVPYASFKRHKVRVTGRQVAHRGRVESNRKSVLCPRRREQATGLPSS